MPTKQPRVNVVVTEEQHDLLRELSALQERSAASIIREMLDSAMPMLRALVPIYRQAADAAAKQPEMLQQAIADALSGIEANRAQLDLLALIAATPPGANDGSVPASDAPSGAREADAAAPPSSNTGVRSEQAGNKSAKRRARG